MQGGGAANHSFTNTCATLTPDKRSPRTYSPRQINQAEDGPSTRRAAIRACESCMVRQHGPAPEYEASKNTPHAAKAPRSHSNTAVPPQLTSELLHCLSTLPDPWPWVFHTGYTMRNHTHDAVPPAPTVLAPAMPSAPAIPANIVGQMTGAPIAEQPEL